MSLFQWVIINIISLDLKVYCLYYYNIFILNKINTSFSICVYTHIIYNIKYMDRDQDGPTKQFKGPSESSSRF